MKIFKEFSYKEAKEICKNLDDKNCYFRHPQQNFIDILGKDTVDILLKKGWLKDSPSTHEPWDYQSDCYKFSEFFRKLFAFTTNSFGDWLKYYVIRPHWFIHKWQQFRIKCGHHYDWQDY